MSSEPKRLVGDKGDQGIQGIPGPAGHEFIWMGSWLSTFNYQPFDVVVYNGSTWNCLIDNVNIVPGTNITIWATRSSRSPTDQTIDFAKLFELAKMPLAVSESDFPNRLVYVNAAYCELTGYLSEDLIGINPGALMQRDLATPSVTRKYIRSKLNAYERIDALIKNYRKDGTSFWNELHIYPVIEEDKCIYWIGTPKDVTERIQQASTVLEQLILDVKETFASIRKGMSGF